MSTPRPAPVANLRPSASPLRLNYAGSGIYLWGFEHALGKAHRDLEQLKSENLVCNRVEDLAAQGYQFNSGIGPGESLESLAAETFGRLLAKNQVPAALVVHHSYPDSTWIPGNSAEEGFMAQAHYFPAALLGHFKLDHVPYLVSFGSGCTGLLSLLMSAAGICGPAGDTGLICLTADVKPSGTTYDARREKILTSDCASGFVTGREKRGFKLLGITYYSTIRRIVPLVEIVKRSVQMIRELAKEVQVDLAADEVILHYPNIFPTAWDMISQYLKIPKERHVLDGLAERAHCLSSDSMISLAKHHGGGAGRIHVVLNFGSGLHLGACMLSEEAAE
jgi:hypothetical protein